MEVMVMETVLDGLLNVATGGVLGFFGSVLKVGAAWLAEEQKRKTMELQFAQEKALQELQMAARAAETEQELLIANQNTARELRLASYEHDTGDGLTTYKWVVAILRLVRPTLTLGFLGLTVYIFTVIVQGGLDGVVDGQAVIANIVNSVLFITSSCTLWWFGDRAVAAAGSK
jgi:hypothetical protein